MDRGASEGERSEGKGDGPLNRALNRLKDDAAFDDVLSNPKAFRFQCSLKTCNEDEHNPRGMMRYVYRSDEEYFYPASTIKVCVAVAALHVLRRVVSSSPGGLLGQSFGITTPLIFHYRRRMEEGNSREKDMVCTIGTDSTNKSQCRITLGHLIRNVFLVSSNGAFNLLLDFVGRKTLQKFLSSKLGFRHFRIEHYLQDSGFGPQPGVVDGLLGVEATMATGLVVGLRCGDAFCDGIDCRGNASSQLEGVVAPLFEDCLVGTRHVSTAGDWDRAAGDRDDGGRIVHDGPKDFRGKNQASLTELQDFLSLVVRPDLHGAGSASGEILSFPDRLWLMEAMAKGTTDSFNPEYLEGGDGEYFYEWNKFFLPGVKKARDSRAFRIYNKLGQAYGFSLDNAYVFDVETGKSFFLAACIYTNANGVLNDGEGNYEYEQIAHPFLASLAEACCLELGFVNHDSSTH
ncbi:hypothetical protein A3770_12p65660 [Chloropicon primus]|uniref:Beta-lactamase class A catalytic domain-containing protein n=3 Tax=Chloropicon primus TaxID=1764295 RepID=A0A5B8MTE6_9CHLO|nr:hypothetical protein A3770_12p65660 [Chloropicon primus]|eukprot:QDZ24048.1 hypothetical protein A3770_12p65660 [Chloropicon primus]